MKEPVTAPVSPCGPSPLTVPCAPFLPISRALSLLLSAAASSASQLCVISSRARALPFILLYTTSRPRPLWPRAVPLNAPLLPPPVPCKYTPGNLVPPPSPRSTRAPQPHNSPLVASASPVLSIADLISKQEQTRFILNDI
jgi:hypothetical protein